MPKLRNSIFMRKIKVLFIDITCVKQAELSKCKAIAESDDINLFVLVPTEWRGKKAAKPLEDKRFCHYTLHAFLPGKDSKSFYNPFSLYKLLREIKPDIIHVQQPPISLTLFQIIILRNLFFRKTKIIFLTWENLDLKGYSVLPSKLAPFLPFFYFFALKHCDHALVPTDAAKNILLKHDFKKDVSVIPWGVDNQIFKHDPALSLREKLKLDGFVVGYVGRLVEEKGILDLLEAVRGLERVKLLVIGRGPLKGKIQKLGNGMVQVLDWVEHEELPKYLSSMDVLVLPSRTTPLWSEQWGRVLVEAMSCGIPVIGSNSGEIPTVIGDAGLIFPEGDTSSLRACIKSLIENTVQYQDLIKKGLEKSRSVFSWKVVGQQYTEMYKHVLRESS